MAEKYRPRDLPPWRVEASRYLVSDKWLRLRADDCVTADGARIAPFYVLDYPDWVQIVALDGEDHIILVEQYRHGLGITSLELPAGAVEARDENPLPAAARELAEETGFRGTDWRYVARLSPNPASLSNHCHVVIALDVRAATAPADDPTERLRIVRLPIDEAIGLALAGGIIQAIHVASLFLGLNAAGKWPAPAR